MSPTKDPYKLYQQEIKRQEKQFLKQQQKQAAKARREKEKASRITYYVQPYEDPLDLWYKKLKAIEAGNIKAEKTFGEKPQPSDPFYYCICCGVRLGVWKEVMYVDGFRWDIKIFRNSKHLKSCDTFHEVKATDIWKSVYRRKYPSPCETFAIEEYKIHIPASTNRARSPGWEDEIGGHNTIKLITPPAGLYKSFDWQFQSLHGSAICRS